MKAKRYVAYGFLWLFLIPGLQTQRQSATVTTIQLFPSIPDILDKIAKNSLWRPKAPAVILQAPLASVPDLRVDALLLKECGMRTFWRQEFTRGKTTAAVEIFDFGDSSGAVSLFSLQNDITAHPENLGDQGFSRSSELWFWQANLVVRIADKSSSQKLNPQLLNLGHRISKLIGQRTELPILVKQLPSHNQIPGSLRYFLGAQGAQQSRLPLKIPNLGFSMGAEMASAEYRISDVKMTLLLINYPTPQIARKYHAQLRDPGEVFLNSDGEGQLFSKRTGPYLALLLHAGDETAAREILDAIHYSASLTWDQMPPEDEVASYLRTILGGIMLTGALLLLTLGTGIVLGIIRLTVKRWVPVQIFDRPQSIALIQLRLNEPAPKAKA